MKILGKQIDADKSIVMELVRFVVVGFYGTLIDMAIEGWMTSLFNGWSQGVTNRIAVFFIQFLIACIGFIVSTPATWSLSAVWAFRNVADEKKAKSLKSGLQFVFWAALALIIGAFIQFLGYMICLEWTSLKVDILNDFKFSDIFSGANTKVFACWFTVFVIRTAVTMVWNYLTRKFIIYKAPKQEAAE